MIGGRRQGLLPPERAYHDGDDGSDIERGDDGGEDEGRGLGDDEHPTSPVIVDWARDWRKPAPTAVTAITPWDERFVRKPLAVGAKWSEIIPP